MPAAFPGSRTINTRGYTMLTGRLNSTLDRMLTLNGVLFLTIPKVQAAQPRRIAIKGAEQKQIGS